MVFVRDEGLLTTSVFLPGVLQPAQSSHGRTEEERQEEQKQENQSHPVSNRLLNEAAARPPRTDEGKKNQRPRCRSTRGPAQTLFIQPVTLLILRRRLHGRLSSLAARRRGTEAEDDGGSKRRLPSRVAPWSRPLGPRPVSCPLFNLSPRML